MQWLPAALCNTINCPLVGFGHSSCRPLTVSRPCNICTSVRVIVPMRLLWLLLLLLGRKQKPKCSAEVCDHSCIRLCGYGDPVPKTLNPHLHYSLNAVHLADHAPSRYTNGKQQLQRLQKRGRRRHGIDQAADAARDSACRARGCFSHLRNASGGQRRKPCFNKGIHKSRGLVC